MLHGRNIVKRYIPCMSQCVSIVDRCYLMTVHDISCISWPGYNEKGFQRSNKMYHPLYCPARPCKKRKKVREKRECRAAIWNSNSCLPVLFFSPKVLQGVSSREIEYAKISLFPGQGYNSLEVYVQWKSIWYFI